MKSGLKPNYEPIGLTGYKHESGPNRNHWQAVQHWQTDLKLKNQAMASEPTRQHYSIQFTLFVT